MTQPVTDKDKSPESDRKARVAVVDKALSILEALVVEPGLGLTDISQRTKVGKTACYRILNTLETRYYVAKDPETRKYTPGNGFVALASRIFSQMDIVDLAKPYLLDLREQTGETVNLGILAGDELLYLDVIQSNHSVRNAANVGERSALHATALGKALLASMDPAQAAQIIDKFELEAHTQRTITDRDELMSELASVRNVGYAVDDEEDQIGGRCVAAAIAGIDGNPVAAISVSGLVATIPTRMVPDIGDKLIRVANELSEIVLGKTRSPR